MTAVQQISYKNRFLVAILVLAGLWMGQRVMERVGSPPSSSSPDIPEFVKTDYLKAQHEENNFLSYTKKILDPRYEDIDAWRRSRQKWLKYNNSIQQRYANLWSKWPNMAKNIEFCKKKIIALQTFQTKTLAQFEAIRRELAPQIVWNRLRRWEPIPSAAFEPVE